MKESTILLDHHLAQTTLFPFAIEIDRAEGIYLYDKSGKKYADLVSGIGVSNLGHGNKSIIDAITIQLKKHMHVMVYGEFIQDSQNRAANILASILPAQLDCCYFLNSGTEANEAALKLAKRLTRRSKIISFKGAYHGSTHGSLSVSGNETKKAAFRPLLPDVHFIRFNEIPDLDAIDSDTSCVIMETIQGDAGVRIPSNEFMNALRKRCDETGAMLILDEIQCGLGRTGKMFAFEHYGIIPDILTLGKALGGGLPVGCMITSKERMKAFTTDPMLGHISTFAGHPVICASVAASLDFILAHNVISTVEKKGQRFTERLKSNPQVKSIRRSGMFFAIDLESAEKVQRVVAACLEKGLITFWFLSCPASFRIAPPLTITNEEIDVCCEIILKALEA